MNAELPLRGTGELIEKSLALLSVSVQPPLFLIAADVLLNVGVGPAPSKQFAELPKPTKSEIPALGNGHVSPKKVVPGRAMAIFPERPGLIDGIMKSGVTGSGAPLDPGDPS